MFASSHQETTRRQSACRARAGTLCLAMPQSRSFTLRSTLHIASSELCRSFWQQRRKLFEAYGICSDFHIQGQHARPSSSIALNKGVPCKSLDSVVCGPDCSSPTNTTTATQQQEQTATRLDFGTRDCDGGPASSRGRIRRLKDAIVPDRVRSNRLSAVHSQ